MDRSLIAREYVKCSVDPIYYAEKYCQVFDNTNKGFKDFILFYRQKELMHNLLNFDYNLVAKPRQAGVSTVTALYAAHQILFSTAEYPQRILIIANKQDTAQEFLSKIKSFIKAVPKEFGVTILNESKGIIKLSNGSEAKAVATSEDALRGFTPTQLIMDEAAFIENGSDVWAAALPALSTGGKAIFISTPNGKDKLYYETYKQSKAGKNDFKITEMRWYEDPRFNVDLKWVNEKREEITEFDFNKFQPLLSSGYKPTSTWYRTMCSQFNNDKLKIAQELDNNFVGSGDNVIDEEFISLQEKLHVTEGRNAGKNITIWADPIEGHEYILGCDVGSGSASDFSAIIIHDITTSEQVFEFHGILKGDLVGDLIVDWGSLYNNALVVLDVTGGYGGPTLIKLQDSGYNNLYHHTQTDQTFEKAKRLNINAQQSKPGFYFTSQNRLLVVQNFEKAIREMTVKIKSKVLISEMRSYIYKNGKPDHQSGSHDDALLSYAMVLYVLGYHYKQLQRLKDQDAAILNGWKTSDDFIDDEIKPLDDFIYNSPLSPETFKKYSWLF